MLRRKIVLLGSAGLVAEALGAPVRAQRQRFDLKGFRQTFAAEFNNPRLPLSVHEGGPFTTRYEQWGGLRTLPGNKEQELYVDKTFVPATAGTDKMGHADAPPGTGSPLGYDPFTLRDGCLDITAVPAPAALRDRVDRPYLSGLISTEWSFAQRYGYFEMRARLPSGRGLWPGFWMVSKTSAEHIEIDVMEAIGEGNRIYHSIHVPATRGQSVHIPHQVHFDYADGMHTYAVSWTERELVFFVDGLETAKADGAPLRDAPPMYLIANLAVGGSWPGPPAISTHFPAIMQIDYIRAYQM